MTQYPNKVFINDEIVGAQEAKISVFDRGFLFGDGIYEALVQINGALFYAQEHFDRMAEGLDKVSIDFDVSTLPKKIETLQLASHIKNTNHLVYIQITRGIAPRKHSFPIKAKPSLMMYCIPMTLPEINQNQMSVITIPDQRWHRCDIKTISLISNVMSNDLALNQNAYEAIFVRNGIITEASHCNIFFVKDQVVYTHPADEYILNGITRKVVLQLCKNLNIEIKEEAVKKDDIISMDEAFLTGTTTQIASIKNIDDHYFYTHKQTGSITKVLQKAFLQLKPGYKC